MYEEFLKTILAYVQTLNRVSKEIPETEMTPYPGHIPVLLDDMLCGFIVDEVGGSFSYIEANDRDQAWWDQRPWKKGVLMLDYDEQGREQRG